MNTKISQLINSDVGIKSLENLTVPAIAVCGRSLKYSNPSAVKEELFIRNNRSSFTEFRQAYGKIKTPCGRCEVISLPTVQGNRFALTYGREEDVLIFFPRHAYDLFDAIERNIDLTYDMLAYVIGEVTDSQSDPKSLCMSVLNRLNHFNGDPSYKCLIKFIEQLVLRITRSEIFEKSNEYPDACVERCEAYKLVSELVCTLATCKSGSVYAEIKADKCCVYTDGILCISAPVFLPQVMVIPPFLSTEKDVIASCLVAFITELFYYEF